MNGSFSDSRALSTAVVKAVAEAEGVDPCDLSESLADVVDPDALDELFRDRPGAEGRVQFRFCEYRVTVTSDDQIAVSN